MCCPRGLKRVERESDHSQLSSNIELMKSAYETSGYRGVVYGLQDVMPRTLVPCTQGQQVTPKHWYLSTK